MACEIVVGVSGGIAAYKAAALVSLLVQSGKNVSVAMTRSAERFVGPATFRAISGRSVAVRIFDPAFPLGAHIELAQRGQVLCIAPATANILAKGAQGIADDLLSTLLLSFQGPIVMAPAMNCQMWAHAAVQRNVAQLGADGVHFVEPQEGWLSCRDQGAGRMAEPPVIAAELDRLIALLSP